MPPQITKEAIEATAIGIGNKAGWAGSGTAVLGSFLHANFVALCGIALAALGYLTSLYFQKRRDKREEIEHQRRMEKWRTRPSPLEEEMP